MGSIYSVTQINSYIKNMFTQDFMLNSVCIKGEVSNCKYHTSGHIYFTLKDAGGVISGVMFAGNRHGLNFKLEEGQNVIVTGSVNIYEYSGKYQIYAKEITKDGNGILFQKYEELKKQLEEMGMFDSIYKKAIPKYALKIGVVTARTGAAIQDIINISKRRNPYIDITLYPAYVQGAEAGPSIIKGIRTLDAMNLDVIIVGRGGGSIEDLWAFNEEEVAKAIFNCNTPIISAVGHETDITIADYVADLRAPTPSAAAELAVFDYNAYINNLQNIQYTLGKVFNRKLSIFKMKIEQFAMRIKYLSPSSRIAAKKQFLDDAYDKIIAAMHKKLDKKRHQLSIAGEKLNGFSPLNRLDKGFAYVQTGDKALKSISQVNIGETIIVSLKDGQVEADIVHINKGGFADG